MSDFRVNSITNQDGSAGPQICGISTFSRKSGVQIPSGPADFRRLDGGGRGRGVIYAGYSDPVGNNPNINAVEIATKGNAVEFGAMSVARRGIGDAGAASATRGCAAGGYSSQNDNIIDFVTISSLGGAFDFGDLSYKARTVSACSDSTRGIFAGGQNDAPSTVSNMEFITISSTGNTSDFGSLAQRLRNLSGCNSPVRGVFAGGYSYSDGSAPTGVNIIQFVTIQTLGDTQDFGDMSTLFYSPSASSNATRGIISAGYEHPANAHTNRVDFITIATTGNSSDFGDLTVVRNITASLASRTRALFAGGYNTPVAYNTIDFFTISTTGNATDFGDTTVKMGTQPCGLSDVHGGLAQ